MDKYRKIGSNIYIYMQKAKFTSELLAEKMSYSSQDIWNVIEGKVMLPPVELRKIASLLGVSEEDLINNEPDILIPNIEPMKEFSDKNNLYIILDLMDEYVEIRDTIERNNGI